MHKFIINDSKNLEKYIKKKKLKKVLALVGKKSYELSGAKIFFDNFFNKFDSYFFFKKEKLPEYIELKKIINFINIIKPDVILSIGGGSVLDYAKIGSALSDISFKNKSFKLNFRKRKLNLISIPITAGSGAEVTEGCVIYHKKIKYSLEDKVFIPTNFFLVPKIIKQCPFHLKATCGLDTLCQSMESIVSLKSSAKSRIYAKKSIKIFNKNFENYLFQPNYTNSKNMAISSNLSGQAINLTKTTIPHALSYPITTIYGLDHGHAVATTLEKVFYTSYQKSKINLRVKKKYLELFKAFGVKNYKNFYNKFEKIKKKTKLDFSLLSKLNDNEVLKIIKQINIKRLKNNPVPLSKKEILRNVFKR
tara:strand:- start:12602 stop:13690 length:1089 start_codon:yes stop_codon:yes gene_type:complete